MSAQMKLIDPKKPARTTLSFEQRLKLHEWLKSNVGQFAETTIENAATTATAYLMTPVSSANLKKLAKIAGVTFKSARTARSKNVDGVGRVLPSTVVLAKLCRILMERDLRLYRELGIDPDPIDGELEAAIGAIIGHRRVGEV